LSKPLLLIAMGNSLRRDDNAGHALAARLEPLLRAASLPVECLDLHQLVPETVEDILHAGMVVFLDASATEPGVRLRALGRSTEASALPHAISPSALLAMAAELFACKPPAFLLTVPGNDFSHGEEMTSATLAAVDEAAGLWPQIAKAFQDLAEEPDGEEHK
jgi:hydrogenase maturation protease